MQPLTVRLGLLFVASLCIASGQFTSNASPCALIASPEFWRGKLVEIVGQIEPGIDNELLLRTGCNAQLEGRRAKEAGFIALSKPGDDAGGVGVTFEWDQSSQQLLNDALASFDPLAEVILVQVLGVFQPASKLLEPQLEESPRLSGDKDPPNSLPRIWVKSVTKVTVARLTSPLGDSERKIAQFLLERRGLVIWKNVSDILRTVGGEGYFARHVRGTMFPGDRAVDFVYGRVVSVDLSTTPAIVNVSVMPGRPPEISLRLIGSTVNLNDRLQVDSEVSFRGVPVSFISKPFRLIVEVKAGDLFIAGHR